MDLQKRKNIRLIGYDYSQNGAYFITVCVKDRYHLLWENGDTDGVQIVGANCVRPCNVNDVVESGRTQFTPTMPDESPKLSNIGKIIDNEINTIFEIYENVKIDKYVIMPNHIHMIILIDGFVETGEQIMANDCRNADEQSSPLQKRNDEIPGKFNGTMGLRQNTGEEKPCRGELCSSENENGGQPQTAPTISRIIKQFKGSITKQIGYSIWQKLFHDHIIRNDDEYNKIWQYIDENPMKWQDDCYYDRTGKM